MPAKNARGGGNTHRIIRRLFVVVAVLAMAGACSDDDSNPEATDRDSAPSDTATAEPSGTAPPRFCDVYLDYLADSSAERLTAVVDASTDPLVADYAQTIGSEAGITEILAATLDLDELARLECQPEWTGGAQGAGSTPAAAQAFYDALVAGDRVGAANVASANAIAVFEPWQPVPVGDGTPSLVEVGEQTFTIVLDEATLAHCQAEVGVVVSCQVQV